MSAANFPAELSDELVFEGNFVDDPQDPGGATDHGITLATLSHFLGRQATVEELKTMGPATERAIYRSMFWNVIQGDQLPSGVDLVVFDMAVNGGPKEAGEMLQRCVGAEVDGQIGPKTLAALAGVSARALISDYSEDRDAYYRGLRNFPRFGDGWLNRVAKCEAEALALAPA